MTDDVAGGRGGDGGGGQPLFRPEALAAAVDTGFGKPIAKLPYSWSLLAGLLLAITAVFAAFIFLGSYSRMETASGVVRSSGSDIRVSAPTIGAVSQIRVHEGQHVDAGAVLLVIDTRRRGADGTATDSTDEQILDREIANYTARLDALNRSSVVERASLPRRLASLKRERAAASAQETLSDARLHLAEEALARLAPVADRGFISGETMRRRRDEVIALQQSASDARATEARLDGQIDTLEASRDERPMTLIQERGQLLDGLAKANRERADTIGQREFAITASQSGNVNAIQTAVGQLIDPQMSAMTISASATKAPTTIELFVPSRAIGFIEAGQPVKVRFDAFPYQRFGTASGRVTAISSTVLRPSEVVAAIRIDEPVYRVLVTLRSNCLSAYGRCYPLRPGLAVSGDIVLDKRSFVSWLLDPIFALKGRM